jgi:RHS repeat-associated protein
MGDPVQGRDGTGQLYRRNRYYDPGTGRFTQEDPIGLAGGLNLYGYANGDPVNFSDPFGLCPPEDNNITDCPGFFTAIGAATGALLGGLGGGTGGAALCVPGGPALAACGAAGGAAGWISGGAAGARLGAWADVAIFASKQAKAVETAEAHRSGPRGVNKHMDLIRGDPGAQDAIHHAGEVRGMLKTIERMAGRMQGRTQEQWRQWIRTTQRELDRLMSGR